MNVKKAVYIICTMFLGLLLSFLAHAAIEIWYINYFLAQGQPKASLAHGCFLPIWLEIALPLAGLVGGYFLGKWWWNIIYVKRRK